MVLKEVFNQGMFSVLDRQMPLIPQGYFSPNQKVREYAKTHDIDKRLLKIGSCKICGEVFMFPLGELDNDFKRHIWALYMSILNKGFIDGLVLCNTCRPIYKRMKKQMVKDEFKPRVKRKAKVQKKATNEQIEQADRLGLYNEVINYV